MASPEIPEPILRLPKCIIRPQCPADAEAIATLANDKSIQRYMRNTFPHPYTLTDAQNWLKIATAPDAIKLAICRPDTLELVGCVGLNRREDIQHRTMELGYWIGKEYRGQGYATEAVRGLTGWAFREFGHLVRIDAMVFRGNEGSVRVLERAGYQFEGRQRNCVEKDGVVMDTLTYSIIREDVLGPVEGQSAP